MMTYWSRVDHSFATLLNYPQHVFLLAIRLYIGWVFLKSGLLKIQSWESTLALFEYEYAVPLLSPHLAAVLGTTAELLLPPLLMIGLFTRPVALALAVFNAVAWISYPDLSPAGSKDHQIWLLGLTVVFLAGAGLFSTDHLVQRRSNNAGKVSG